MRLAKFQVEIPRLVLVTVQRHFRPSLNSRDDTVAENMPPRDCTLRYVPTRLNRPCTPKNTCTHVHARASSPQRTRSLMRTMPTCAGLGSLSKDPRVKPTVSLNRETVGYRYINPRRWKAHASWRQVGQSLSTRDFFVREKEREKEKSRLDEINFSFLFFYFIPTKRAAGTLANRALKRPHIISSGNRAKTFPFHIFDESD